MFSLTPKLFRSVLLRFQIFRDFPYISLLLISNPIPLWSESSICLMWGLYDLRLVFWVRIWSHLEMHCGHLKRMCTLIMSVEFYNCQWAKDCWQYCSGLLYSYLFFFFCSTCSTSNWETVLTSPNIFLGCLLLFAVLLVLLHLCWAQSLGNYFLFPW